MKMMDYVIISIALIIAGGVFLFNMMGKEVVSGEARIYVEGKVFKTMDLSKDAEHRVETEHGYNIVVVKEGQVSITEADCKDEVCIYSAPLSGRGGILVCLPHKLHIEIESKKENEVDAISN